MARGWEKIKDRVDSCFSQVYEASKYKPKNVLAIGAKRPFLIDGFKRANVEITTYTPPPGRKFTLNCEKAFDVIVCAGVLAHMPYKEFGLCLQEIKKATRKGAVIVLPDAGPCVKVNQVIVSGLSIPAYKVEDVHYWEIGTFGYGLARIRATIFAAGFTLEYTYRVPDNPFHRVFVLSKRDFEGL